MVDVGRLASPGANESFGYAINNLGQIVGEIFPADHAFEFNGPFGDLGTLAGFGYTSAAQGINDSGQIVGASATSEGGYNNYNAFLYSNGTMVDLNTLTTNSIETYLSGATGINNNGQIICSSAEEHGFLYSSGMSTDIGLLPGGSFCRPLAINNNGQVVGVADTTNYPASTSGHAFLYCGGTMIDLGALEGNTSGANGINNTGQIVGTVSDTLSDLVHAFVISDGVMYDLNNLVNTNALGTYLDNANGINDSGQIAANGANGHAYLLTLTLPGLPPRFQAITGSPGHFTFSWNAVNTYPALGYQVQYTTNLAPANWINLGGVLTGPGPTLSATDTNRSDAQRFYRILLVQ